MKAGLTRRELEADFPFPKQLHPILAAEYPRFSNQEMARRRRAVEKLLAEKTLDHLVFCGAHRFGSGVQWLTQWPVTAEAVGVFSPGQPDALFVQYVNHAPLAQQIAQETEVAWGGESCTNAAIKVLERRNAKHDRVGVIGPMQFESHAALVARFGHIANLNRDYVRLRQIKSKEEIDWLRAGATFSDRGMAALRDGLRPGRTEYELGDCIERGYAADGGTNWIHYIAATPMHAPIIGAPRQFPSPRKIQAGDVVFAEISAAFFDHAGQVLRSFAVEADPPALYLELHAVADTAFDAIAAVLKAGARPAEVIEAAAVIETAGFTIIDDLLHGYGGGYLPPILGCKSRPAGPVPEDSFKAGQTVVIQPNVVTTDRKAGVQTGELVLITETGIERLQRFPRGFCRV